MRRVILLSWVIVLLVSVAAVPGSAAPASDDPFRGAWTAATEKMTLAISGGGPTRHVVFHDFCDGCDPSGFPYEAVGWGEVDNGVLHATVIEHGPPWSGLIPHPYEIHLTARDDGTLWFEPWGIEFIRQGNRPQR